MENKESENGSCSMARMMRRRNGIMMSEGLWTCFQYRVYLKFRFFDNVGKRGISV